MRNTVNRQNNNNYNRIPQDENFNSELNQQNVNSGNTGGGIFDGIKRAFVGIFSYFCSKRIFNNYIKR